MCRTSFRQFRAERCFCAESPVAQILSIVFRFLCNAGKGKVLHINQRVSDMAVEVLERQARAHAEQTGEAFEDALESVLKTEAGRQLRELCAGPHGGKMASQWQGDLTRKRRRERVQAAWDQFMLMEAEQRELEQQKESQLV